LTRDVIEPVAHDIVEPSETGGPNGAPDAVYQPHSPSLEGSQATANRDLIGIPGAAVFEQMSGKGMSECMAAGPLGDLGPLHGFSHGALDRRLVKVVTALLAIEATK
jgi:hypothetical protein